MDQARSLRWQLSPNWNSIYCNNVYYFKFVSRPAYRLRKRPSRGALQRVQIVFEIIDAVVRADAARSQRVAHTRLGKYH